MPKCEVTEVLPLSRSRDHPVIAHFQHGSVHPKGAEQMDCFRAKEEGHSIIVAAVADNVYTGVVGEGFSPFLRNFVGIRNKITNKIRLIEVEECSLISKHYDTVKKYDSNSTRTVEQARRKMMTDFGGKTANRNMERTEKMRVNVDIVKDQLDKTMNDTLSNSIYEKDSFDIAKELREDQLQAMLPKMNKEATLLSSIYTVTDLISADLLNRLEIDAVKLLQTPRESVPIESEYLLDIIDDVRKSKEPDCAQNLKIIKIIIYIDALITFQKNLRGLSKSKSVKNFSSITEKVENDIRSNFKQPSTNKIIKTDYIIHKVISYAIVLSLLISNKNEIQLSSLIAALSISKSRLLLMAAVLPIKHVSAKNMIGLKLPSKMKPVRQFTRKRKD